MSESILAKFKKSPSFSFRGKFSSHSVGNNPEHLPSPNDYTPQKPVKNQIKIVFAKSQRKSVFDRPGEKSPGPGQYETAVSKERSYQSLKEAKNRTFTERFVEKSELKPGPGAYDVKKDFKKTLPSFSMSKKTKSFHQIELQHNSFKQAPGAYEVEPKLSRTTSLISIPKSPRMVQKQNPLPGPGRYETGEDFYSQRSFGKRNFATSQRKISFQMKNYSPGPGRYVFESAFERNKRKEKGFSCRKRFDDGSRGEEVPGPGNYENNRNEISFRSTESVKMPKALRDTLAHIGGRSSTPGPGNYQNLTESYSKLKFKSASAPKFSKAKLEKISAVKMDTTDKFYDAKITMVRKSSSSYSIGAERRKSLFEKVGELPGPGDYNSHQVQVVKEKVLAPKFPRSLRSNPILNKLAAGPGQYFNPENATSFSRTGTKFSKGQRKTDFSHLENQTRSIIRISNSSHVQNLAPLVRR